MSNLGFGFNDIWNSPKRCSETTQVVKPNTIAVKGASM